MSDSDKEFAAQRAAALEGDDWTDGEKFVLRWQFRDLGGFWTRQIEAMTVADPENMERLRLVFPEVVEAVLSWREGDLGERFSDAGLLP